MDEINHVLDLIANYPAISFMAGVVVAAGFTKGRGWMNFALAILKRQPLQMDEADKNPANGRDNSKINKHRIDTLEVRFDRFEAANHKEHKEMMRGLAEVREDLAEVRESMAELRTDVSWIKRHLQNGGGGKH